MRLVIGAYYVLAYFLIAVQCLPINNGFSVKFNPLASKEEVKQKIFGALFAKIPQSLTSDANDRRQVISKSYYPNPPELLGAGCSNQVAKIVFPVKSSGDEDNDGQAGDNMNFINLPILKQPFENYKILVATAPSNLKLSNGEENKPLVIYIVFPEEGSNEEVPINIPSIYFVSQHNGKVDISKKKAEPVFIIDSNRTVTGLKSREIEKFVRFKNKLTNRYNYQVSR